MNIRETVIKLWEQGFTSDEILNKTTFSRKQINSVYTSCSIHANRYTIVNEDDNLLQFMMGNLLGDATITKISGLAKHSRFSVAHKKDHVEYIKFKHNFLCKYKLGSSKISEYKIYNNRYKKGFFEEVRFKSKSNPYFDNYRKLFYPRGIKIIPDIINKINDFGLTIWYMDDGSVTNDSYSLATNGFSEKEVERLIEILYNNFELKCSKYRSKDKYQILIYKESAEKFCNIINSHILPIMKYKLVPYKKRNVLYKLDKLLENPGEDNQQPTTNLNG